MKRKEFIKKSTIALASGMILPQISCTPTKKQELVPIKTAGRKNWAGNYTFKAPNLYEPSSVDQLQELVKTLKKQKALGSQHCFNNIADSPENQISTKKLNKVITLDKEQMTFTVEAGARYGDFSKELHEQGFALHNLASLPHITVAGACATATHGSGVSNGNLATAVRSVEMVTSNGDLTTLNRDQEDFYAVVVGLGAFGIITKVTLDVQETFEVRQDVFLDLPLESLQASFDDIMSAGYSVSLFTDWMDKKVSEVWVKRRMDNDIIDYGNEFYGAMAATENVHPILELSAESCSEQMGVPGPWYDRLPHFKMGFQPSAGEELQSEFFIPRKNAVEAIMALEAKRDQIYPHLMITEIRTIAGDDYWMSPCYKQDSVAIHFTWKQKPDEVMSLLPVIEETLAPFEAKPHWGKLFTLAPTTIQDRYEKYEDFVALARTYDPGGKFKNNYLLKNIY